MKRKAILIDPERGIISMVEIDGLDSMYALIGCKYIEAATMIGKDTVFVDEEGLLDPVCYGFTVKGVPQIFIGKGLICGHDDYGKGVDCTTKMTDLIDLIDWVSVMA